MTLILLVMLTIIHLMSQLILSMKLFKWFADNQMKANQDKCHLIVSKNENISMHIGPFEIKNTNCEKLLGIKVDSRLNFNEHLDGIIEKAQS